jgi:hypothetical protein
LPRFRCIEIVAASITGPFDELAGDERLDIFRAALAVRESNEL